jgi:hypothetical protein
MLEGSGSRLEKGRAATRALLNLKERLSRIQTMGLLRPSSLRSVER